VAFPYDGKKFPPETSGNPAGRPKGRSITARLRDILAAGELGGKSLGGKQVADLLTDTILKGALKGDFRFVQFLIERTEQHEELVDRIEALEEALRLATGGRTAPAAGGEVPGPADGG
jgi:hypothetical protein